jgi:hypothetical protein
VDPVASLYAKKVNLRRLIEAEGIPHTYVCCNGFAETYLPSIGDVTTVGAGPPSSKITVLGDGDAKGKLASFFCYQKSAVISQWLYESHILH